MPPRRKKAKVVYQEEDDEELEEAPPPPPPEEEEDDDGDTGPVDRRASTGSKRSRDDEEEFQDDPLADEDDEDDDDEDARADAAERRLAGRIAREDAEDSSSAGLIKEIYCENFMCHKKLEIKLGRRINFINGANGSGKSAILAAMQICLGASAKQTHRGNKLGDLVREGSDATAVVVKLVNEGTDAFRHETYGDTIGIRRRFGKKGGGKLDMLNENDEKVTSDRKELRSLLDSLKISVDNPVCVLDQENSKHFIRGKAKDKYKFFLRATEIQDVMERIKRATNAADKCISDAEHQRTKLESFARLAQNAQREYEEVMRLAKYDEEIRDLKARRRVSCRVDGVFTRPRRFYWDGCRYEAASAPRRTPKKVSERSARN